MLTSVSFSVSDIELKGSSCPNHSVLVMSESVSVLVSSVFSVEVIVVPCVSVVVAIGLLGSTQELPGKPGGSAYAGKEPV